MATGLGGRLRGTGRPAAGLDPLALRYRHRLGQRPARVRHRTVPRTSPSTAPAHLAITARREDYQGRHYTSGRINTSGKFEHAYGRFEARIRLPIGQGIWPAFWLLGADFAEVGWPACGEIDIMEYRGQEPKHRARQPARPGLLGRPAPSPARFQLPGADGFNEDFHIFAVEWEPERITWIVDEERFLTVTPRDLPSSGRWVFDHPFFIILNVAVGGNFVGPPDASTTFPQTMLVDCVRVYRVGS